MHKHWDYSKFLPSNIVGFLQCLHVLPGPAILQKPETNEAIDDPSVQDILQLLSLLVDTEQTGGDLELLNCHKDIHCLFQD